MSRPGEITGLLAEWSAGDQAALKALVPIMYDELRCLASNYLPNERANPLLQTTALVHEADLRFGGSGECELSDQAPWQNGTAERWVGSAAVRFWITLSH